MNIEYAITQYTIVLIYHFMSCSSGRLVEIYFRYEKKVWEKELKNWIRERYYYSTTTTQFVELFINR